MKTIFDLKKAAVVKVGDFTNFYWKLKTFAYT